MLPPNEFISHWRTEPEGILLSCLCQRNVAPVNDRGRGYCPEWHRQRVFPPGEWIPHWKRELDRFYFPIGSEKCCFQVSGFYPEDRAREILFSFMHHENVDAYHVSSKKKMQFGHACHGEDSRNSGSPNEGTWRTHFPDRRSWHVHSVMNSCLLKKLFIYRLSKLLTILKPSFVVNLSTVILGSMQCVWTETRPKNNKCQCLETDFANKFQI